MKKKLKLQKISGKTEVTTMLWTQTHAKKERKKKTTTRRSRTTEKTKKTRTTRTVAPATTKAK